LPNSCPGQEKPRLVPDIGDKTFLMLRNHGLLVAGGSVPEAFLAMSIFEAACAIQINANTKTAGPIVALPSRKTSDPDRWRDPGSHHVSSTAPRT
jgi:ribulose-5-phosphate 4-epimerase/fuculose-1-phosphate aldolase